MRSECKLEYLCSYVSRGITPSYTQAQQTIVLNQKCIRNGVISLLPSRFTDSTIRKIPKEKYIKKYDVLINSTGVGTLGRVAMVKSDLENITVDSHITIVRPNDKVHPIYLGYNLLMQQYKIESLSEGSTGQTELSKAKLCDSILVRTPSYAEQKSIAEILSCLDDKIELNNRINKNIEAQAQAIFKSWFVDFEPFQDGEFVASEFGQIPKGWRVGTLSEACSQIVRGITPKYIETGDQIIVNQKCIREHQVSLAPARYHVPKKINEKWLQYGDILVNSTGQGTLGRTAQWYGEEANITVDSHVTIVRPKEPCLLYYMGQFIMGKEYEIEAMASGSTGQTELSRELLGLLKVIIPPEKVLEDFSDIIEPFMKQITINNKEALQLATLRDTLLPKLMNGEIQIPQEV